MYLYGVEEVVACGQDLLHDLLGPIGQRDGSGGLAGRISASILSQCSVDMARQTQLAHADAVIRWIADEVKPPPI